MTPKNATAAAPPRGSTLWSGSPGLRSPSGSTRSCGRWPALPAAAAPHIVEIVNYQTLSFDSMGNREVSSERGDVPRIARLFRPYRGRLTVVLALIGLSA